MRSSIDHLHKFQETPKYSPLCLLAVLSNLYQRLLAVAKENPSEQQTYLNIDLVVHHQNDP